ncbi:MAG: universal stress protein [Caldilineaceae bacterium]|nr:universal stress protein [Caldilineaceae bacterium]
MYKTILTPLDGSARAERILPQVEAIAERFGAEIVLLQVIEPASVGITTRDGSTMVLMGLVDQQISEARAYLEGLRAQIQSRGLKARVLVAYGPPVSIILDAAEREGADLIAMASHGRTGLERVFYGSVAAGVLNQASQPLLLIHAQGS